MNVLITVLIALDAGFGVYRSCTKYADILPVALTIDVVVTGAVIAALYWFGFLTNAA